MNGKVKAAKVTVNKMLEVANRPEDKKRAIQKQNNSRKQNKQVYTKQPENGRGSNTKEIKNNNDLYEQHQKGMDMEEEEKECILCKNRSNEDLVDLSENFEMRKRLSEYLGIPLQEIQPALENICVQCVLKINVSTEITRNLSKCIRRVVNGQASNSTTNSTFNSNDISPEKQTNTCLSKPKSLKQTKKIKATKHLATPKKINTPPDKTILQATANSTPANACSTPLNLTHKRPHNIIKNSSNASKIIIENSPSGANTPRKPHRNNKLNTTSKNSQNLVNKLSSSPSVALWQHQQNGPVNLTNSPTPISINLKTIPNAESPAFQPLPFTSISALEPTHVASIGDSDEQSAEQNHSMLEVYYERSESAIVTESGGEINRYKSENTTQKQLICPICRCPYKRQYYFAKHVRRCRARSASRSEKLKYDSLTDIASAPSRAASRKRIFYCDKCPITVDSIAKLRDHKHIHLTRFYCDACGKESLARQDHEYHVVKCLAEQMIEEKTVNEEKDVTEKRMTRSMSRVASRCAKIRLRKSQTCENSNAEENVALDENDDDEVTSVADTMYTKRMRLTGLWLEDHSNSVSDVPQFEDNTVCEFDDELQLSEKELEHYRLDKLQMEIFLRKVFCFVDGCKFYTDNLVLLMAHEYEDHKKRLWFHCKKCRCGFTSKVHLDYHLACQNGGRFICYKCGELFEYQHLLDRHLIRHIKNINHRCSYCNFEFLSEDELVMHCDIEQHDANDTRKLISIDPTMTIINKVPPEMPQKSCRNYQVKLLEMKLPKTPTKRPMARPGHLPYRLRVGEVLFENQKNPNCWGWK